MDSILLGLSLYAPTISDEEKKGLELRFAEGRNANRCETCGVSIDKSMCYHLYHNDSWYNACSMCYMPANLDKIDYHSGQGSSVDQYIEGQSQRLPTQQPGHQQEMSRTTDGKKFRGSLKKSQEDRLP